MLICAGFPSAALAQGEASTGTSTDPLSRPSGLSQDPLSAGLRNSGLGGGIEKSGTERDHQIFDFLILEWNRDLEDLRQTLTDTSELTSDQLAVIREESLQIEERASERRDQVQREVADATALLRSVAPNPTQSEALEPRSLRNQRARLEERLQASQARVQQADLTIERARQVLQRIAEYQQAQLRERLLARFPTPILPSVAISALGDLGALVTQAVTTPLDLLGGRFDPEAWYKAWPTLAIWITFGGLLIGIGRTLLYRRFGRGAKIDQPSMSRKLLGAIICVVTVGVLPVVLLGVAVYIVLVRDLITGPPGEILQAAAETIGRFLLALSLLTAAIAPRDPHWRLSSVPDEFAPAVFRRALALLLVLHLAVFVGQSANELSATPPLLSMFVLISSVLFSVNLFALLRLRWKAEAKTSIETPTADADDGSSSWLDIKFLIRVTLVIAAIATPLIALAGYSRLSIFVMSRFLDIGLLLMSLYMTRFLVQSICTIAIQQPGRVSRFVRSGLGLGDGALDKVEFWFQITTDTLMFVILILGIALIVGVTPGELQIVLIRTLAGVQIGSITLAPGALLAAAVSFVIALMVTRVLQRGLSRRIFPHTHIDTGVQHSVNAAIGYGGVAIALLVAVAVAGIDLSNIALIAGALSVGIGFGLQAIVNNFVSGLILLAERPIKVGDWIRIGDHEGSVKRINVRSTEIQTFKRTDVIVPNSDLISNAVVNFTHKDRLGRLEFPVPVGFDADPDKVSEILMKIAHAHPNVVAWPEPHILFKGFGTHTMQIELRVFLGDIWTYYFTVISDINFAIVREFRAAGVPFQAPYQDIHMLRENPQAAGLVRVTPVDESGTPLPDGQVEAGEGLPER
jgi:small-conductance mechanosensitive channel